MLDHARSPWFWFESICFFLIATHFEFGQTGSGFAYAIKLACLVVLFLPRFAISTATVGSAIAWIAILAGLFLLVNVVESTDRAIIAFALVVVGSSVGLLRDRAWEQRFVAILTGYLVFHLGGFAFQIGQFLLDGRIVELHGLIFPSASRAYAVGNAARLSGFHIEPGTYTQWMLMVTFLRCLLVRRIASPLSGAVVVSTLTTLSLWALIGVALFAAAATIEAVLQSTVWQKVRVAYLILFFGAAVVVLLYALPESTIRDAMMYLDIKSDLTSQSGVDKLVALAAILDKIPDVLIIGAPMSSTFCDACLSPQDLGVWASLIYYFGLLPAAVIVGLVSWSVMTKLGVSYVPLLAGLLLWKAQFYDPLLWIIVGGALRLEPIVLVQKAQQHWAARTTNLQSINSRGSN
ncbi:MAG: hypothetical protein EOP24_03150 [Hyphomicrobiales bacterium]|nr:MAG: hypothetical protein EOP24_03150 [Hyphomicrobiales bacterium]